METINQNLKKIKSLLQNGRYETVETMVTELQTDLSAHKENLNLMKFSELRSLHDEIEKLSKLAEGLYEMELTKIRTKRIARMLYAYQDLTE